MKKLAICAVFALVSGHAFAAAEKFSPNINEGNWSVSGASNMNFTSTMTSGTSSSMFSLSTTGQYFTMDKLGMGATAQFATTSGATTFGIGPAATYYVWNQDHIGVPVSAAALWNHSSVSSTTADYFSTNVAAGLQYFMLESLAVGPSVSWTHQFSTDTVPTVNTISAQLGLSLLL